MALTVAVTEPGVMGNKRTTRGTIAFDSSYPTGGESLTAANIGLNTIDEITFQDKSGYSFEYDYTNALVLVYSGVAIPTRTGIVDDSDTAATAGADLQIAISDHVANAIEENAMNGLIGRFEAINAGNASIHTNQVGTAVAATNPTFSVWDNDNAETETAVMADVYVAKDGGGFFAVTLSVLDAYVPLSNGEFIKVAYDADPATNQNAVQVYYDDNATNANERLMAVVVDNLDETFAVATELSLRADASLAGSQIASTTDLSAVTGVRWQAMGR